ncbi:hypothetical protein [Roseisolibacter sp. H3M3-2]|uniref:hypothetical protein n=1 Tax=Roseisolibacter sp. H3M3-2 TaxID=3031323 RepID=UPI0023DB9852|nr:hypothetical protein [Roseisolibacter sp. H3M3-2]MDF1501358.1 hypothetical protein [Roseisolibacter sp. H3M3-2]
MPDQPPDAFPEPPPGTPAHPLPLPVAAVAPDDTLGAAPAARAALGLAVGKRTREGERTGAPHSWDAHEVRQERVADAVRTYTRVLRGGGAPLAAALVVVASEVRRHAASGLSTDARSAVERDAACSCLEAYYGP